MRFSPRVVIGRVQPAGVERATSAAAPGPVLGNGLRTLPRRPARSASNAAAVGPLAEVAGALARRSALVAFSAEDHDRSWAVLPQGRTVVVGG